MLAGYPVQDVLFVASIVLLWAIGYQSGMHR